MTEKTLRHGARRANAPSVQVAERSNPDRLKAKPHSREIREARGEPTLRWQRGENGKTTHAPLLAVNEKIDPARWLESLRKHSDRESLFDFDGYEDPDSALFDWYRHSGNWSNRLVHADSKRAMASLLEHEHMAGQVQMIYFDPPYGMDFDAKHADDVLSVTAFRDTYDRGIHSYLDGLSETLELARELLSETGSLFLQIGDVNVNRVAVLLDEVFGSENRMSMITFNTTGGGPSTRSIPKSADYILWYAKDREQVKFQQLYEQRGLKEWCDTQLVRSGGIDLPDETSRPMTPRERNDPERSLPEGARPWQSMPLTSRGASEGERGKPYTWNGTQFGPAGLQARHWSVDRAGLDRLANAGRLCSDATPGTAESPASTLRWKLYRSESPGTRMTNVWSKPIKPTDKRYPVQTGEPVIQRCMLMTTDPGDLVLDPTSGGGTTAVVAETWGRRWIAVDSSRSSVQATRARVLARNYPLHELVGSSRGHARESSLRQEHGQPPLDFQPSPATENDPAFGIVTRRMKYVSAAALAYEGRADKRPQRSMTRLVDRPYGRPKGRVCSAFTVETELASERLRPDEIRRPRQAKRDADWETVVRKSLLAGGIGTDSDKRFEIRNLADVEHDDGRKTGVRWIADVIDPQTGEAGAFAIAVAPQDVKVDGRVTMKLLDEAGDLPMVVVGTEFDDPSAEDDRWRNKVYRVRAGADLHIGEVTEKAGETPRLTLVSELDAEVVEERGRFRVRLKGANEWNPVNRRPSWRRADEVRMWMLDTDHDGFQFHACRIHLPEKARLKEHRKFLLEIVGKDGDPEAVNAVFGMESMPFDAPQSGEIAIRAVLVGGGISTALLKAPAPGPAKGNAR